MGVSGVAAHKAGGLWLSYYPPWIPHAVRAWNHCKSAAAGGVTARDGTADINGGWGMVAEDELAETVTEDVVEEQPVVGLWREGFVERRPGEAAEFIAGLGPVEPCGTGEEALEEFPPPIPRDPPPTGVIDPPSCDACSPSSEPVSVSTGDSAPLWEFADWEVAGEPGIPMLRGPRDSWLSENEDSGLLCGTDGEEDMIARLPAVKGFRLNCSS
jgi:hypothetical protein